MELVGFRRLGVVGVAVALVAGALVVGEPAAAAEPEADGGGRAAAPAGTLLETITVPVDGSTTVSTTALDADTHYTLLATGEFRIGGPGFGDAEYAYSGTNQGPIDYCFDSPAPGISSHTSERSDAALVSASNVCRTPSAPRRLSRNDPPQPAWRERRAIATSTASTQPRTCSASFTIPARPARSHPATSTANNPAIASPTPRSSITQPLSIHTINQGEAGHQPP